MLNTPHKEETGQAKHKAGTQATHQRSGGDQAREGQARRPAGRRGLLNRLLFGRRKGAKEGAGSRREGEGEEKWSLGQALAIE